MVSVSIIEVLKLDKTAVKKSNFHFFMTSQIWPKVNSAFLNNVSKTQILPKHYFLYVILEIPDMSSKRSYLNLDLFMIVIDINKQIK